MSNTISKTFEVTVIRAIPQMAKVRVTIDVAAHMTNQSQRDQAGTKAALFAQDWPGAVDWNKDTTGEVLARTSIDVVSVELAESTPVPLLVYEIAAEGVMEDLTSGSPWNTLDPVGQKSIMARYLWLQENQSSLSQYALSRLSAISERLGKMGAPAFAGPT